MGIENIKGLDKAIKSDKENKGMFWCDECDKDVKSNMIFDEETNSFICGVCENFVEYISSR